MWLTLNANRRIINDILESSNTVITCGYLVKRLIDQKLRKTEINHSLFQQNRIKAVSDFFVAYSKTEHVWQGIPINNILSNKLNTKELDSLIWPPLDEMKKAVLELKIYFEDGIYLKFKGLLDGFLSINRELSELYFDSNPDYTLIQKSNNFHSYKKQVLKENEKLLTNVCKEIRKTYKS